MLSSSCLGVDFKILLSLSTYLQGPYLQCKSPSPCMILLSLSSVAKLICHLLLLQDDLKSSLKRKGPPSNQISWALDPVAMEDMAQPSPS